MYRYAFLGFPLSMSAPYPARKSTANGKYGQMRV